MFFFQCEETAKGEGCTIKGVCGKTPQVAALQDLLVFAVKGIGQYAHRARQLGAKDREIDVFVIEALFTTVTNVNFDEQRMREWLLRAHEMIGRARELYYKAAEAQGKPVEDPAGPCRWVPADSLEGLVQQGEEISIIKRIDFRGQDIAGLEELLTYGLKGMAAYADHALILGQESDEVFAFFHEALNLLAGGQASMDELLAANMKCGEVNLTVMGLLDAANTGAYGHPEPTQVRITPVKGKCILISGHDLKDLEELLKQTEGTGINVYTHCEMLPANAYPEFKKYKHLVGNYGGAWHQQQKEFEEFPGAIVMTTNCIQEPLSSYKHRIFTSGLVAWPGVRHIQNRDFSPVIEAALAEKGFEQDAPEKTITIGFAHNAVLSVADKVIEAVKSGAIRHFFLVGGCDAREKSRDYYTQFARQVPDDCVVLTLACGKFRFNTLDFGDIGGIPRLLDAGQCNDAHSAIEIASALANAFECSVNDLPLTLILSWYEQKAVCILLSLLSLGIRNIRLGPRLPAFVTPNVLNVLVEKFNIQPVTTAEQDLAAALGTPVADATATVS